MASVTLVSKSGAEVIVDTTREFLYRVYNLGWMPKTGTVESNYETLLSGITDDDTLPLHDYVRIGDITQRTTSGVADLFLANFLGHWVAAEDVKANDYRLNPSGQIIRRTADGVTRPTYDATEAAAWTVVSGSGGAGGTTDPEIVRDTVASFIQAGANTTVTHNDAGDALTIAMVPPALDLELVRDTVALMVRAGTGMSVVHDDAANALILSSTGGAGGGDAGFIDGGTPAAPPSDNIDGGTP